MKLTLISLLLLAVIIFFGIMCRAQLVDFCETAVILVTDAKNALDDGDLSAAAQSVKEVSTLCDRQKKLMQIYLNHSHYIKLKEELAGATASILAGDIKSAYSDIAVIISLLENLKEYDDIVPENIL